MIIYKPGLIIGRDNDFRLGEKIASYIPGISKINASELALAIFKHALSFEPNQFEP